MTNGFAMGKEINVEKIKFSQQGSEPVEFYVLEQTRLGGVNYLLVTDKEDGDAEALILRDLSSEEDTEGVYEIVRRMVSEVPDIAEALTEDEKVTVMLAGLLHDIGHYPLSHVCEFPYKKKKWW